MSIEIRCDEKNCISKNMETFYCEDCYITLEGELEEAKDRIATLEAELEKMST